ncbi:2-hydroxyacid dehydrogenase [Mucilaginibacter ginsenosidivorans]|uniref:2-hydroxyacid dehydrogenase n=1 Tax=Mucilaginibacter ginsenosidivorans TaxID=398053 RepID=A0A5B8UUM0_9SPHI|nr:2-hydroxyacid dehydrogenase [Mucilaginibacter ginsenosidivorans]QEC62126.1 2-hydroxyacid dehydrogenase [Mucilaginibacter ginsenosidivorans]
MKVVAYSIKPFEKEFLARANQKKHDITLISNPLGPETASFAAGKDAVLVFTNDDVSAGVIDKLADFGVKYIATRSSGTDHIDKGAAEKRGIRLANVPAYSPEAIAEHAVALALALNRKLIKADEQSHNFDFRLDNLIGFNFHGKTVGIIGLGKTGLAAAAIFNGFGCRVLGHDILPPKDAENIELTDLNKLFSESDIISIHVPLNDQTKHLVDKAAIALMKDGVMIVNTSRGALIQTTDVLNALDNGKIGYLGLDVYEFEKGLFFTDHEDDKQKDALLKRLMDHPNVLITPHQGFLTREALQEIANQTIINLDLWQQEKCVGDACIGNKKCNEKKADAPVSMDHINLLP